VSKPLVERRRRERINRSIDQLKSLLVARRHVSIPVTFCGEKAKFRYTGPTGPARTLSETRTDPTEFLGDPGRKQSPCGSGRVRVVEFS